ncbi:MAG: GTP pyrophosphokinase family protein [Eubacterium sp.]|nr:GTP pyrophosphokinase family protein [Eubacterium sp.]
MATSNSFQDMMMRYQCAIMEVETKIKVLNEEFSLRMRRNTIESIKTRMKSPASIYEKMERRGFPLTIESMEKNLNDIAGVRVICSFPDDIYSVARLITEQDDIVVLQIKDYIANPKPNGYRSLHLIVAVPIFLANEKKNMKVEIQFRTIAMDFWASLEHKVKYKKDVENPEEIARELKECADIIASVDKRMQDIEHSTSFVNKDTKQT